MRGVAGRGLLGGWHYPILRDSIRRDYMGELSQSISKAVEKLGERARKYRERGLNEDNTKASLIEPMLDALGWDIHDPEEVHREFKRKSKDKPVDYALKLLRNPVLFIEAKAIGGNLSDHKWVSQVLGYATVAGIRWCLLTDGDEYRLYNATAQVHADEKLFLKVRISEDTIASVVQVLNLISHENLKGTILDDLWRTHFVDRRVKATLRTMLDSADKSLVYLVRKRIPSLKPKEVAESIGRLDFQIESPTAPTKPAEQKESTSEKRKLMAGQKAAATRKDQGNVTLKEMIDAGFFKPPVSLFKHYKSKKYKGKDSERQKLEGKLRRDGTVEFQGEKYPTCSAAATAAKATISGKELAANGWSFWRFADGDGKEVSLQAAREAFLKQRKS